MFKTSVSECLLNMYEDEGYLENALGFLCRLELETLDLKHPDVGRVFFVGRETACHGDSQRLADLFNCWLSLGIHEPTQRVLHTTKKLFFKKTCEKYSLTLKSCMRRNEVHVTHRVQDCSILGERLPHVSVQGVFVFTL